MDVSHQAPNLTTLNTMLGGFNNVAMLMAPNTQEAFFRCGKAKEGMKERKRGTPQRKPLLHARGPWPKRQKAGPPRWCIHDTPLLRASANTAVREGMWSGTVAKCVATTLLTMSKSTLGDGLALSLRPRAARYQSPRAMTAICTLKPADSPCAVGARGSWKQPWHSAVCTTLCRSATRLPT